MPNIVYYDYIACFLYATWLNLILYFIFCVADHEERGIARSTKECLANQFRYSTMPHILFLNHKVDFYARQECRKQRLAVSTRASSVHVKASCTNDDNRVAPKVAFAAFCGATLLAWSQPALADLNKYEAEAGVCRYVSTKISQISSICA